MRHPTSATAVAFSPDGRTLAAGYRDGSARLWDLSTGLPLGPPLAQRSAVLSIAFAPDGRSFRGVAADASLRAWAVPAPAAEEVVRMALRLEVRTGQSLDKRQAVVPLSADEWEKRRRELVKLEGTVERAYDSPVDPVAYHDARALDAEQDGDEFGAEWHRRQAARLAGGERPK